MSGEPTLSSINENLNGLSSDMKAFIAAQRVINESNTKTMDKIGESMAKSDAMQIELNGQSQRVTELSHKQSATDSKVVSLSEQVAVNKVLVGQTQDLKKMFAKSMVGIFVMFLLSIGSSVYSTNAKQVANLDLADQLAKILTKKNNPDKVIQPSN